MKNILIFCCLFMLARPAAALINPNFTPVQLVNQSTAIWEVELTLAESGTAFGARTTHTFKGEAPAAAFDLDFSDREFMADDLREPLVDGKATAILLTGDFSGASMGGGEVEEDPWAMIKLGTRWYMVSADEGGALRLREDPIDLSTVWAGDPVNLRQVTEYITGNPRATVPVASGGRWAEERQLGEIEGTVTGMEAFTLATNPLVIVYREEGDLVFSPAEDFKNLAGYLGLDSASRHAAWGRFTGEPVPSMMSLSAEGGLVLWARDGETFTRRDTGLSVEEATGIATVALPGRAGLLVGAADRLLLATAGEEGAWSTREFRDDSGAGPAGGVFAIDLNGDGMPDLVQSFAEGVRVWFSQAGAPEWEPAFFPHGNIGEPMSLALADLSGNGALDVLVGGDRGSALLINDGRAGFTERLATTGELSYNIRPGVNVIGVGDHPLDGRVDLVLFNHQLPPQIYFNRGFAVFGYDMELDLIEDAPDAQFAAGEGQRAGLLADLTGNGLQELLMVTSGGEFWLLTRDAEATTPLGATLTLPPTVTGPVPLVVRDGDRVIGARIAAPHQPAFVGRRNRGPVRVTWRHPGAGADHEQQVIVLRPQTHALTAE